jgi:hydrogenase maturation protein HypF
LPYTPLHHLLMEHFDILVMTSANFTDEPIAISNDESLQRLKNIADYFLSHNREILQRCDDSIVRVMDHKQRMIRRSRGYIPAPVFISKDTKKNMLAVGGELKNTIALSRKNEVFFSQHIGDLDNPAAYRFFENSIAHLKDILQIKPDIIVCDMHPEYLSSKWAKQQNLPLFEVQHHHAHLASVLAEKHIDEPAIGIILDGTGYGPDGTIWGGEVLVGDAAKFERYAWFDLLAMPGGKAAIKEPWRMAYSYLKKSFAEDVAYLDLPVLKNIKEQDKLILDQMLEKNLNAPLTSSCGRLFDAVSAILGVCRDVTFEAQAAIELEMHVDDRISSYYDQVISDFDTFSENIILTELIKCVVNDYLNRSSVSKIAAKFHNTLAQLIVRIAMEVRSTTRLNKVALSGGVFQNMFLFDRVIKELKEKNFEVITHTLVPANDGGLALGQIAVANTKL